jgi:apolipoprotein N-acyltransferase
MAWVALAPLIVSALARPPRQAFAWGLFFGTVFFTVLLRWLNFTFRVYSAIPWPLTWLPTVALAAYCALYVALFAAGVSWVGRRRSVVWALAVAPCLWVTAEWLRGHLFGGFPWGLLGYSQYLRLPVIQIAELGGVYAVSFLLVVVNGALAGCFVLPFRRSLTALGLAAALVALTLVFGRARLEAALPPPEATIGVMQPSIEQPLKWDPNHLSSVLAIYFALSRRVGAERPELLVWPETASPTLLRRDPALLDTLVDLARSYQLAILVGSVDVEGTPERLHNSAFLVTARGIEGRYDKMQLVPFGEYVPLSSVIGFVRGWAEFISEMTPGSRSVVFPGPPAPFGIVICYEGIFPELFREFVRGGARLMVNMTNDAWFGRTSGPFQHLTMYPFRAVEHRIAVVRAANTGVSAFIAPTGQITRQLSLFTRGTMIDRVPLRIGQTLYGRLGDWLVWLSMAASAVALGARRSPA